MQPWQVRAHSFNPCERVEQVMVIININCSTPGTWGVR